MDNHQIRYLPFGKRFHLFFIFCNEKEDKEWVLRVVDEIESFQYICGYNERDYDRDLSIMKNFEKCINDSCAIGLLISELSITDDKFVNELEGAIHIRERIKSIKPPRIIPLVSHVIDSDSIPCPLLPFIPLCVSGPTNDWLHILIKAIDIDESDSQTDSDEKDEEDFEKIQLYHDMLVQKLRNTSIKNQKKFLKLSKSSGISYYVGQMGRKRMQNNFMNACGVEAREQTLYIKWQTFSNILENSVNSLTDLVLLNKELKVNIFSLQFEKDAILSDSEEFMKKIVTFATQTLHCTSTGPLAFKVKENGFINEDMRKTIAELSRQICLKTGNFKSYIPEYDTVEKRIKTYKTWPKKFITFAAEVGFIYTGVADSIVCCRCNFSLYGCATKGTDKDNLLANHYHFSKDCPHLQGLITPFIIDLENELYKYSSHAMSLQEVRMANRKMAQFCNPWSPDDISDMGFLILGQHVRCFTCKVKFAHFETKQDLENKHIQWSPDCEFLKRERGIQYIKEARKNMHFPDKRDITREMIIEILSVQTNV